jgi:hypothetical protein
MLYFLGMLHEVLPHSMVDNSTSPSEGISSSFFSHATGWGGIFKFPHAQSLKHGDFRQRIAQDARVLTTVGWFSPLPALPYAAGLVALAACHLSLAAARASPGARHEDATSKRVCSPLLEMSQQVWRRLSSGPGATRERYYPMTNAQIHPRNYGGISSSREA